MSEDEKKEWIFRPNTIKWIIRLLVLSCIGLALGDLVIHKHSHFPLEDWFGFYAIYGFIGCVGLVIAAKCMRVILMRKEDYYDDE